MHSERRNLSETITQQAQYFLSYFMYLAILLFISIDTKFVMNLVTPEPRGRSSRVREFLNPAKMDNTNGCQLAVLVSAKRNVIKGRISLNSALMTNIKYRKS